MALGAVETGTVLGMAVLDAMVHGVTMAAGSGSILPLSFYKAVLNDSLL
ncbi:hypothetical protein lbkm_2054 [Lachnospiraceae bacterium KM106-2]|nr:hypothetical protein lbkm_2054 [Lachnospiraceae bacterium KM106-2]